MPKATGGGASNAQLCAECGAQVAPGAPRCPECPSTEFTEPEAVPDEQEAVPEDGGGGEPAEDVRAPDAAPEPAPAAPPRVPPRLDA